MLSLASHTTCTLNQRSNVIYSKHMRQVVTTKSWKNVNRRWMWRGHGSLCTRVCGLSDGDCEMAGSGLLSTCFNLFEVNLTFLESVRDGGGVRDKQGPFSLQTYPLAASYVRCYLYLLRWWSHAHCKQLSSFFVVWKDKILHLAFWKSLEVHSQCGSGYVLGYEWLMRIGAVWLLSLSDSNWIWLLPSVLSEAYRVSWRCCSSAKCNRPLYPRR